MTLLQTYDGITAEEITEEEATKKLLGAYGDGHKEILEQLKNKEIGCVRTMFAWIYTKEEWEK
jgi:hypothetical protein